MSMATLNDQLASWRQRVAWQLIDRDRAYGAQCWDLSADWAEAVCGIAPVDFWTSPAPGPDQYAASSMWLYYPTHPTMEAKLARIGRHDTIRAGDILVWARSNAYPGSHTAVALETTDPATGSVYCMTQNPGPARAERLTLAGYLGALRPRTTTPTQKADPDMPRILNLRTTTDHTKPGATEDKIYLDAGPGVGIKHISSPAHLKLLQRFLADASGERFYPAELAIINSYLAPDTPILSAESVEQAVTKAIQAAGGSVEAAAVAAAVEQVLADDFAAIPAKVAAEQSTRLAS